MKIIQKVLVKHVITEQSKDQLKRKFQQETLQLEQECQQLLFEQRRLQRKHPSSKAEIAKKFKEEIDRRKERMDLLNFKSEQLKILEIGSEITEKEVDALVEVEKGMKWEDISNHKAIIIKDGKVIRMDG